MEVTAGPARRQGLALLGLAGLLAVLAARTDPTGALLAVPAAAVALALGLRDLLLTPVLQADSEGLRVVQGLRRVAVPWRQVERIRVVRDRRAVLLEVDTGDAVLLLSRSRLGRYPQDVLDELVGLRPP